MEQFQQAIDNSVRPPDTNIVFFGEPGRDGMRKPYSFNPYSFNKVWMHIKKSVGLADLRHEAVSCFVEGRLSDQQVAAINGHKSMQMLRRYTHVRAKGHVEELDNLKTRPG